MLHLICGLEEAPSGRLDLSDPKEFLQVSLLKLEAGKAARPHRHIWKDGEKSVVTQECWIVMKGRIECTYYDTDDAILAEEILQAGDCSITFLGGHRLAALDEGAVFYEIKNGPYKGQANDHLAL